jgi:hypothetical protein
VNRKAGVKCFVLLLSAVLGAHAGLDELAVRGDAQAIVPRETTDRAEHALLLFVDSLR